MTGPAAPIFLRLMRSVACALLALTVYTIIGTTAAAAQAGNVGIPLATCIAPMRSASPSAILLKQADFDCVNRQSDYGSGDFDVVATKLPAHLGRDTPVVVRFASVWQDRTTLYARYADGGVARVTMDAQAISSHLQLGAVVEVPLPVRGQSIDALLWRIKGAGNMRGVVLSARVATPADSARSNLELGAMYAAFGGLCLALLVYNFALWVALRYRFQLAYCAMVATLAVYAFSFSGALAWVFPTIPNEARIRINYAMLAIAVVAALSFARSFFEARVVEGWLSRLINAVGAAVLVAALVFVLFANAAPVLLDRYYSIAYALVLLAVVPTLVRAYVRRSNYLWLFAIGWAAPIGFAALRIASNFHLVPYGFWLENSTIFAMSLEALLSSLAIAYRIHLVTRERDQAREQESAARLLAATDPLTGLLNRRAFLEKSIGRTGDQQLLVVDIDHFKRVNETLGHDGGDEVLRVFSRALRAVAPADAVIARLGGEEFAILVDAATTLSTADILDTMRAERMPFDLTVTASIGVCVGPLASEIDWKRLYRQADLALFEAKAAGRDRARHATLPLAA